MTHFRQFSSSDEFSSPVRNIDSNAPSDKRNELIDLIFHIVENNSPPLNEQRMHRIICQSLGETASGKPYAGFRHAAGRDLGKADWPRVYDLICRLWSEFESEGLSDQYREGVNRILSGNRVVWDLNEKGQLQRHLPLQAQTMINTAINELNSPEFAPALKLFNAANDAFNDHRRRDRDACSNIFDSMESVAKQVFNMPDDTFGSVLTHVSQIHGLQVEIISVLKGINTLRNHKFGHGMTEPFNLSSTEVDFTYLTCIGGILLFARSKKS